MTHTALIAPEALQPHLADPGWVVFDCRHALTDPGHGERVYAASHLPGARFAHMERDLAGPAGRGTGRHPLPDWGAFARWLDRQGVGPRSQAVAYDDSSGAAAARLWWMLRALGHDGVGHGAVAVLDGGFARWQREGRPVTAEVPRPQPGGFLGRPQAEQWVELDELQRLYRSPGVRLVDARSAARYRGEAEPIDPVAGHIPHALNLPQAENVRGDGTFLPAETLRGRFRPLAGTEPQRTVHYCGSGVSACHNMLAMAAAGLAPGRLYVGSWSQWCADPARPVETGEP
ncbi:MAG: sulfurtransferase [Candidatus Lambdaproteobacteria bacterium]|nr:sulfurtransferase [Candidatus Lambdaproteobacteria bacterium]